MNGQIGLFILVVISTVKAVREPTAVFTFHLQIGSLLKKLTMGNEQFRISKSNNGDVANTSLLVPSGMSKDRVRSDPYKRSGWVPTPNDIATFS